MDYGKLAYLRTDELEARINASEESLSPSPALYREFIGFSGGEAVLLKREAASGAAYIVKVELSSGGGKVHLKLGGLRAATALMNSGQSSCVMFAAGGGELVLDLSELKDGAENITVEILVPQGARAGRERASALNLAVNGNSYALVGARGGDVRLEGCDSRYENRKSVLVGRGGRADVCAVENGFFLVYSDSRRQLMSVSLDCSLGVIGRGFLGDAPDNFSVTSLGDRVYLFYAEGGKAKYFSTEYPLGTRGAEAVIDYAGQVDGVTAVKDAESIAVVLSSGGKLSLLKEETGASSSGIISVTLTGRCESV